MKLKNKVAVVTGGTSGIGLAAVKLFSEEGANVALIGRDEGSIKKLTGELKGDHLGFKGDVTSQNDLKAFFQEIKKKYGRIDVLFVNAGISKIASIAETNEAFYDELFNINVKGAFYSVQNALPLMGRGSTIVMTSSTAAHAGYASSSIYCATKASIASFVKSFAAELVSSGIRVNAVSPGPIATPIMTRNAADPVAMAAMMEHVKESIPMKRLGQPEEVAKAILFLASDDSTFTTGAEILVDGGSLI